ncbi:hypothetical protein KTH81_14550 [Lachnospiraceae bacterium ASD3451]|uniref:hypothetical protein n=1 Tax=Diplocloster agilis TaxID=2850323 RepID=UPI001E03EB0F|nr:hypothetical protein [Diplocloster agilis]MBU9745044.1 hypothetical protein [Diplocloster agilis]
MRDKAQSGKVHIWAGIVILLAVLLFRTMDCFAAVWPPVKEDEKEFLRWYEEHKNEDARYVLSGDLWLTLGTEEQPIILDGSGHIQIECGPYAVVAASPVVLDNENLRITETGGIALVVNSGQAVSLYNGKISAADGTGILLSGEIRTDPQRGDFHIEATGESCTGVYYSGGGSAELSGLYIRSSGTGQIRGVYSFMGDISLADCDIAVSSTGDAYGIYGSGAVSASNCIIEAAAGESGHAVSVYSQMDQMTIINCSLTPPVEGAVTVYQMINNTIPKPLTVQAGTELTQEMLPDTVLTLLERKGTKERIEVELPVQWEASRADTDAFGVTQITGVYLPPYLPYTVLNPENVTPRMAVISKNEEKGMFPVSYQVDDKEDGTYGILFLTPYPYGASSLEMEYSQDKENWSLYRLSHSDSDLLKGSVPTELGLFSFYMEIPCEQNELYVRFLTGPGSSYEELGDLWLLDLTSTQTIPPVWSGSSEGDRGGAGVNPPDRDPGKGDGEGGKPEDIPGNPDAPDVPDKPDTPGSGQVTPEPSAPQDQENTPPQNQDAESEQKSSTNHNQEEQSDQATDTTANKAAVSVQKKLRTSSGQSGVQESFPPEREETGEAAEPSGQDMNASEPGPEVKPSQNPEEPPGQTGGETDQTRRGISPWKAAAVILCCLLIGAGLIYLGLKLMRKRPDVPTDQK